MGSPVVFQYHWLWNICLKIRRTLARKVASIDMFNTSIFFNSYLYAEERYNKYKKALSDELRAEL